MALLAGVTVPGEPWSRRPFSTQFSGGTLMKTIATPLSCLACIVLLAGLVLVAPAQAQNCVSYQGIDHCPVGLAVLSADADGLTVSGLGSDGQDGVESRFDPTTFWTAQMAIPAGTGANEATHFSSISAGKVTSELQITPENGRLHLQATFTGDADTSTYSVLIYNDGILVGSLGGFSGDPKQNGVTGNTSNGNRLSTRVALYVDGMYMGQIPEPWWWPWVSFGIGPYGGCIWGMSMPNDTTFDLPNGHQVVGDEVRFEEDVEGSSHYPYLGFEAIATQSTASSFKVVNEMAEGTSK